MNEYLMCCFFLFHLYELINYANCKVSPAKQLRRFKTSPTDGVPPIRLSGKGITSSMTSR